MKMIILQKIMSFKYRLLFAFIVVLGCLSIPVKSAGLKPWSEDAVFHIFVDGKKIGQEKFTIKASEKAVSGSSTVEFKTPGSNKHVRIETEETTDERFVPQRYMMKKDIDGKKGSLDGIFVPGQAHFSYPVEGRVRESGLLVGERYSILDENVFHHFIFIARLFEFDSRDKKQSMEVIIPQELANGILRVAETGIESVVINGKKRELHHLTVDTGKAQLDLWVDNEKVLYKIAFPARQLEVIRN
jgi:hypothetical protein